MNRTMNRIADTCSRLMSSWSPQSLNIARKYNVASEVDVFNSNSRIVRVCYRGSEVATIYYKDKIILNSCGYSTMTTKNVINAALRGCNSEFQILQKNYDWWLWTYKCFEYRRKFFDGIEISLD